MAENSGLTVRQHRRDSIELAIEFVVCDEHAAQVQFSPASSAVDQRAIEGITVDVSRGGMGLVCRHFIPRHCEGVARVFDPIAVGARSDGTPVYEVAFEHRVKVRRVVMLSHEPSYAIGVSFVDPGPDIAQRVDTLQRSIAAACERQEAGDA